MNSKLSLIRLCELYIAYTNQNGSIGAASKKQQGKTTTVEFWIEEGKVVSLTFNTKDLFLYYSDFAEKHIAPLVNKNGPCNFPNGIEKMRDCTVFGDPKRTTKDYEVVWCKYEG